MIVPDKGLDRVHVFKLNADGKLVEIAPPVGARSGAAPRHVVVHPNVQCAYVVNELDSTVTTYRFDSDAGTLQPLQIIPTIPTTFTGDNTGAEIVATSSVRFVYASNRGHDSIASFTVEPSGGLAHAGWTPTLGRTPRFIGFDPSEDLLYAANQASNTITEFRLNGNGGALTPIGNAIEIGSPSCIAFASFAAS